MDPSVEALEEQYFLLRGSIAPLRAQGATDSELTTLGDLIAKSRDNYWQVVGRIFHQSDPQVVSLTQQITEEQAQLQATLKHIDQVARVLNLIAKAVETGTQLAGKAAAA